MNYGRYFFDRGLLGARLRNHGTQKFERGIEGKDYGRKTLQRYIACNMDDWE